MDISALITEINRLADRRIYQLRAAKTLQEAKLYGGRDAMVPCSVDNPKHTYTVTELEEILVTWQDQRTAEADRNEQQSEYNRIRTLVRSVLTEAEYNTFCRMMTPSAG